MAYKLDKTSFSSQFGSYQVFDTWKVTVDISGSLPAGKYNRYQKVFNFTNDIAKARTYIERADNGLKAPFDVGARMARFSPSFIIYQPGGGEIVETDAHYATTTQFVVNLFIINNTGGSISLVTQTLNIVIEFYDVPIV